MRSVVKLGFSASLFLVFMLLAARASHAADLSLINQTRLSPVRVLETTVKIPGQKAVLPIAANDVAVGGDGVVWLASDHGVFRLRGGAWSHVPTLSTSSYNAGFTASKRIDVDASGAPWVIDTDGVLYTFRDDQWVRVLTNVRDVGAGKSSIWLIPSAESNFVKASGGAPVVLKGDMAGNVKLYPWQQSFGEPVAIAVDDADVPHVVSASGQMVKSAQGIWQPETVTCSVSTDKDCDPTRTFSDVAASNGTIWIAGTGRASGDTTFHHSYGRLSGDQLFPAIGPPLKSVGSDPTGNLYGVNARREVVFGEISFDYQASGNVLVAALGAAFDAPFRRRMTLFDGSQPGMTIDIPEQTKGSNGYNYQAALDPTDDLTVSFSIYPPDTLDPAAEGSCILSYRSSKTTYLSICVDSAYANLIVTVGSQQKAFPVQLRGEQFVDVSKQPLAAEDVGRKFVFRSRLGEATLETVSAPLTIENGAPKLAKETKFSVIGKMLLPALIRIDRGGARIHIGSSDGVADRYRGYLGTVRIFDAAVETRHLLVNWQNGEKASAVLPGYPGLLVEAVLNPENKAVQGMSAELLRPLNLDGYWYVLGAGKYYSREIDGDRNGPGTWGIDRVEVLKLAHLSQATPLSPQRLSVIRDGEGGVAITSFEQTGERTYKGWQDPLTRRLADEPVELTILDENTVKVLDTSTRKEI